MKLSSSLNSPSSSSVHLHPSSTSSNSPTTNLTANYKPQTRNKVIKSSYRQNALPSRNYSKLNCLSITEDYTFILSPYSTLSFPYEINIFPTMNIYHHTWQILLDHTGEDSEYLGINLINKMNENIMASYKIIIKNQSKLQNRSCHRSSSSTTGGRFSTNSPGAIRSTDSGRNTPHMYDDHDDDNYDNNDYIWEDPEGEILFSSYGSGDHYWGTEELIHLNDLEDPVNGYLLNNQIILKISITALVSDELRILSSLNHEKDGDHHQTTSSMTTTSTSTDIELERATKQLNNLSEQISQKVRLLSEDALLQDKLIHARLGSTKSFNTHQQQLQVGTSDDISIHTNNIIQPTTPGSRSSFHTTSHVSISRK